MIQLFVSELLKLNYNKLWKAVIVPVAMVYGIVLFNSVMQGSLSYEVSNFKHSLMKNWNTFFLIWTTFYVCYQVVEIEIISKAWEKYRTIAIPLNAVFFSKVIITLTVLFAQFVILGWLEIVLNIAVNGMTFKHFLNLLIKTLINGLVYSIALLPACIMTLMFALRVQRIELVAGFALPISCVHIFIREQSFSIINVWSWPYLMLNDRITIALVAALSLLCVAFSNFYYKRH